jgi:ribosomal protein L7/L12
MPTTKNYYAQAINIVADPQTDFRKLVIEIAKQHPKVIVQAHLGSSWEGEIKSMIAASVGKIEMIRHCRNITGMGLMEAKAAVEALMAA